MQLHALEGKTTILAIHAQKHRNYLCPECGGIVRLRGGRVRQFHYYHVRSQPSCRQHQKSLAHLHIQLHLKSLIPEASLEKSMPAIGRIADVAWEERKTIFEVQCSPISLQEAEKRNSDYAKCGYTVIWLLHDKEFNRKNLSPAELYLRKGPCYFVNGNKIYDQFEVIRNSKRIYRSRPILVNIFLPWKAKKNRFIQKRFFIPFRWKRWYQNFLSTILERFST